MGDFTAYSSYLVDLLSGIEIMYINTVLAQSDLFYPTLIMIPIGLYSLYSFDAAYFAINNDREEYEKL